MCRTFAIVKLVTLVHILLVFGSVPEGLENQLGLCGKVHLTVSPLQDNYLELNWVTRNCTSHSRPDYIVLSKKNLKARDEDKFSSALAQIRTIDYPNGYYKTKIKFREGWLPGNWEYNKDTVRADEGPHCLPYWISSIKYDIITESRCLSIEPTWMYDNRHYLAKKKIGNLVIPGTHNSGSYKGIISYFEGYVLNQDQSVWNQLVFGIRYLDFRIGYLPDGGFHIFHDHVKVTKIEPILEQIKKFAELAPQEIIFIDFHRFPFPQNFTIDLHHRFTDIVYYYLGDHVVAPLGLQAGSGPTLNEIWSQNRSIIISYADRITISAKPWLWNPLKQFWGDTNNLNSLKQFLYNALYQHKSHINPMWALMAELTPTHWDVLLRKNNLRELAQTVNKEVTKWIRDEWFNDVNIVATDYFLGNDLVRIAIEGNIASSY
ncbi:PI-PLC X domain-containing protein 1-like [Anthonomus grandis grandis]|uniref:PI-PLC X domain-containing protein 1-like n=1 Tax=Anthonomus grandis grandis TaxID=2921223 RepID=UPI002164FEEE|nr:PI-PLC X domain-containing protein 1-like [Anthonomus grandis grandis]